MLPACPEYFNENQKVTANIFGEMRSKLYEGKKTQSFALLFIEMDNFGKKLQLKRQRKL